MKCYHLLDWFFMTLHPALILFNLFGWLFRKTRKVNLIILLMTAGSWFILGLWRGIGYCPLTDWHYRVLNQLGEVNLPDSYISYLIERVFKYNLSDQLIDGITITGFLLAVVLSIYFNIRDFLITAR